MQKEADKSIIGFEIALKYRLIKESRGINFIVILPGQILCYNFQSCSFEENNSKFDKKIFRIKFVGCLKNRRKMQKYKNTEVLKNKLLIWKFHCVYIVI